MRTATSCIIRDNGRATGSGGTDQNEVDLLGMSAFVWVYILSRKVAGGSIPSASQTLVVNFTTNEEDGVAGQKSVNFKTPGESFATETTDGGTLSLPTHEDLADVGDSVLRVVYGETRHLHTDATTLRYINMNSRVQSANFAKASVCLLFPKDYIQNMKYIGRARTDARGITGDADAPYTQIDERLFPEVCVLQADGTFYDGSAL